MPQVQQHILLLCAELLTLSTQPLPDLLTVVAPVDSQSVDIKEIELTMCTQSQASSQHVLTLQTAKPHFTEEQMEVSQLMLIDNLSIYSLITFDHPSLRQVSRISSYGLNACKNQSYSQQVNINSNSSSQNTILPINRMNKSGVSTHKDSPSNNTILMHKAINVKTPNKAIRLKKQNEQLSHINKVNPFSASPFISKELRLQVNLQTKSQENKYFKRNRV